MMDVLAATILLLFLSNGAWILFTVHMHTQHKRERSELYSRLMAGNLTEYAAVGTEKPSKGPRGRNYVKRSLEKAKKKYGG